MNWATEADLWVLNNAAYPTFFALGVALFLGAGVAPEIWNLVKRQFFPYSPKPDWRVRDCLEHLITDSIWAYGNRHSKMPLPPMLQDFRQKARDGEILVWGKPETGGTSEYPTFLTPGWDLIPKDYWRIFELDEEGIYERNRGHNTPHVRPAERYNAAAENKLRYTNLKVNRRQCTEDGVWRKAPIGVRLKERFFGRRL